MPGIEAVVLGTVIDFLKNVSAAATTERLKPRTSPERAAQLAWTAYEQLEMLATRTDAFVQALRALPAVPVDTGARDAATARLRREIARTRSALRVLSDTMWELSAPLSVHHRDLYKQIHYAGGWRSSVLGTTEALLGRQPVDRGVLTRALEDAEHAQREIEDTVEQMRVFLSREFTFKDSFPR